MNLLNWRARNVRVIHGQSADKARTSGRSATQRDEVTNCYEDFRKPCPLSPSRGARRCPLRHTRRGPLRSLRGRSLASSAYRSSYPDGNDMAERPKTSGAAAILGEAVAAAPDEPRHGRYSVSRATQPCGTYAAARRHERLHEPMCAPCTEARRTYYRERARLAYSMPAFRHRENLRSAARMAAYRRDPAWRARADAARMRRARRAAAAAQHDAQHCVDDVVVRRLIAGESVPHNRAERLEAVRLLRNRGASYPQIAALLHITERQVHRDMTRLGLVESTGAVA